MRFIYQSSDKKVDDLSLKTFQIRQKARLCIFLVTFFQFILRLCIVLWDHTLNPKARRFAALCLPFPVAMDIIILLEYLLFKKRESVVVRFSKLVDIILLLCFMGDCITGILSSLFRLQQSHPPSFQITSLYAFTAFAWRTLLITLLVQRWQLKIIAPIVFTVLTTGYTIHYSPGNTGFLIYRCIAQSFFLILIIYCEDKVKWGLMRTGLEHEKWNQVNNFILDSLPENIMILELSGEGKAKFMSEYCKAFLKKCSFSIENGTRDFFKSVQNLQQQEEQEAMSRALQIERLTTCQRFLFDSNENESRAFDQIETLEDLVFGFQGIIQQQNLQEKQFLIYNGKLKMNIDQKEEVKSIEIKISFVQHLQDNYIILIFRDMTQRDLLITLQETNKYKDQLLASVSHELRAPLNGNINLVEGAVGSASVPESIKEALLIPALRSSKFLLHLINDILDMSQIKEKKLRLVFEIASLKETLKNAVQLIELQAKKKGIELMMELDPNLPRNFCTDHLRLSQIVLNLLTNATKFTKEGMIKLVASPFNNNGSWIKITVEDSGIGMSPENLKKLFSAQTYIDFEGKEAMSPTGVGMGLNIASNLVQLLAPASHQSINVSSIPNQGSTFSFIIEDKKSARGLENSTDEIDEDLTATNRPIISPKPQSSLLKSSSSALEATKSKCLCPKVLIVDDNAFNTMALETILNSLEIKCDSVYNGSACIQKLLSRKSCSEDCQQYSVVFMDQEMPEMSGSEAVKEIKRLQSEGLVQDMKIVGCTAHKAKEEVDRFLASGLDQCIFKPVSILMIKDILKEIF